MTGLKIASRNFFRNLRRSLLSVSVLVVGFTGLALFSGFIHFSYWGIREIIIHVGMGKPEGTGHFQIYNARYFEEQEKKFLDNGIGDWKKLVTDIEKIPEVAFAIPRTDLLGLLSSGEKTEPVIGFAVVADKEVRMPWTFGTNEPYKKLAVEPDGIILGAALAKKMLVQEGDYVTLLSTTVNGAINAVDLKFAGTVQTGNPEGDSRFVLMNLKYAENLIQSDRVRYIAVMLREKGSETEVKPGELSFAGDFHDADMKRGGESLSSLLEGKGFKMRTWRELNTYYDSVEAVYRTIFGFIGVIVAIVVVLSIYNTMFMSVVERTNEIGTLMAVGTPRRYIMRLFLLEGMIISLAGGILGYCVAYIAAWLIAHFGLTMPPPPGGSTGYPLVVHVVHSWWTLIMVFIILNSLLASFLTALRAARMSIVDALHHV